MQPAESKGFTVATIDPATLSGHDDKDAERDAATGLLKKLKVYAVREDPEMLVVPNFLSDAEAEHMLAIAEPKWEASFVQVGANKKPQVSRDRTSYSCTFDPAETKQIQSIEMRLANLAGMSLDCLEQLALVRYKPGQQFNQHHDGENRPKTIFVYLNDLSDEAGGHTIFPELGLQIRPRKGCAVIWSNTLENGERDMRLVHAGLAPTEGIKYGVNCFFHHRPLKIRGAIDGEDPLGGQNNIKIREEDVETQPLNTIDPASYLEEGASGQLCLFTVNLEPKLSILPNFLSAAEAEGLVAFNEKQGWDLDSAEEALIMAVQSRIAAVAGEKVQQGGFHIAKCAANILPDGLCMTGNDEYCQRFGTKTVMIFLSEVLEDQAGELRFPRLGLQVRPRLGAAVLWSTVVNGEQDLRSAHQGRKLSYGTQYTAFCSFGRPSAE